MNVFLSTWDVPVHSFHPFLSESSERQGNDSDVSLPVGISCAAGGVAGVCGGKWSHGQKCG